MSRTALALAAVLVTVPAFAQRIGSLAEWKKRVLDPATVGVEPFPGATLNMKFTIDQIRLDETKATMAVYVIPSSDIEAAAEYFAKQLGSPVEVVDRGGLGQLRVVRAKAGDAKRAGLIVRVEPSEWATGKGQVWLRRDPPVH